MKKYTPILSFALLLSFLPLAVNAAEFAGLKGLIAAVGGIVKDLILLAAGIGLLGFFYGLAIFIFKSGDPKKREESRGMMIWGMIALFVMVSVWGIISFFQAQLGIYGGGSVEFTPNGGSTNGGTLIIPTGKRVDNGGTPG